MTHRIELSADKTIPLRNWPAKKTLFRSVSLTVDQRPATGDSHPRRARYHLPRPSGQQPETFTSPPCRATVRRKENSQENQVFHTTSAGAQLNQSCCHRGPLRHGRCPHIAVSSLRSRLAGSSYERLRGAAADSSARSCRSDAGRIK